MGKKKSGRNNKIDDEEYNIVEENISKDAVGEDSNNDLHQIEEDSLAGKKKSKGKKGKKSENDTAAKFSLLSLEDGEGLGEDKSKDVELGSENEASEIAFTGKKKSRGKKGKKSGEDNASKFVALSGMDDEDVEEGGLRKADMDKLDEDIPDGPRGKTGSEFEDDGAAKFSLLSLHNGEEDEHETEPIDRDIGPHDVVFTGKKKSKGKGGKKDDNQPSAFSALVEMDAEEERTETPKRVDVHETEPQEAVLTGKNKSKGKKDKKDDNQLSNFSSLVDMDTEEDVPLESTSGNQTGDIDITENVFSGKKKSKGKKGKPQEDSEEFPEIVDSQDVEPQDVIFEGKKKSKGKKDKKDDQSSNFSSLANMNAEDDIAVQESVSVNQEDDIVEPEDVVSAGKKKSKGKKSKKDDQTISFSSLAGMGEEDDTAMEESASGYQADDIDETEIVFTGKKKSKGKKDKKRDDFEVGKGTTAPEQKVEENEGETQTKAPEEPSQSVVQPKKQKKKNKKSGRTAEEEDDLDKILAELGEAPMQPSSSAPQATSSTEEPSKSKQVEPEVTQENIRNEPIAQEAIAEEPSAPAESAAAKKKKKKKEKEKEKKAAAAEAAAAAAEKKDDKKLPKHIREMQERLARAKEAEEKKRQEEEERRRKEEEERLRLEEEQRLKEEMKRKKKEREKEKLLKKKQEGKLLTGKKKEEARRLDLVRKQFLAQSGLPSDIGKDDNAAPKKPRYDTKKKKHPPVSNKAVTTEQPVISTTTEEVTQQEEDVQEMEVESVEVQADVDMNRSKVGEEEEEEEDDDWDAKSWDDKDVALPIKSSFAEEEEEEEQMAVSKGASKSVASFKSALVKGANGINNVASKSLGTQPSKPTVDAKQTVHAKPAVVPTKPAAPTKQASGAPAQNKENSTDSESESDKETESNKRQTALTREARKAEALSKRSSEDLRSPICCILGHVDTGKTKLLDCIRRTNVQEGEAGGITQQIGATYFPMENIRERTKELKADATLRVPGLLVIDTPGHESFTNLRSRGSGLCDIAILVVDIMHGLEPQTIESLNLLKMRHTPFVVALNKVDRLYSWKSRNNAPIRNTLKQQSKNVQNEFEQRLSMVITQLKEQGLNSELYYKNKEIRKYVSIVPTSAISGEGIPDLLLLLIQLTQKMMEEKLMYISEVQCTVLEVKVVEGLGTTIDVVLINGVLHEGDQIVVCGMQGPIVTNIRALLTPHPMKELRVKGSYQHHKELKAAQGIKITAQGLEHAIAGTQLYVVGPDDDLEDVKEEAMQDMRSVMSRIDKSGEGVCVQASTLGSLEALLEFLKTPAVDIPVSGISIGPVHKKDVMRASVMLEKKKKEYAAILAFDVKVTPEARELADELGVRIFMADIIYHLFDQFTAYVGNLKEERKKEAAEEAVFPCVLKILPNCVFNKKDPIIVGVDILEGVARVGTQLCVPTKDFIDIGRIASIEINHKAVSVARKGQQVAMKIAGSSPEEIQKMVGRHFDVEDELVSHVTRRSIDILKENYRDDLTIEDWRLVLKLKKLFKIP
eukprot:TRINITY_DN452_c0_g2_i1.p1 TRINITY_DN452_c0_g2~~TRINITY_DN452_c0_g2_i1.p1  ORF type:complete len:1534 (-),score=519.42 TRINITY_DN452_c0_g2_i1:477-5078(-)